MSQLDSHRFAASCLVGKLANICGDLSRRKLRDAAMFKAITGGDTVVVERKYKDQCEVDLYVCFVGSIAESVGRKFGNN